MAQNVASGSRKQQPLGSPRQRARGHATTASGAPQSEKATHSYHRSNRGQRRRTTPPGQAPDPSEVPPNTPGDSRDAKCKKKSQPRRGEERHLPGAAPGLARDHPPTKAGGRPEPRYAENCTYRSLCHKRRGTHAPKPSTGPSHEWWGTKPRGPAGRIGERPPTRQHRTTRLSQERQRAAPIGASTRIGEGPPTQTKANSRPQPGRSRNCTHRALSQDWRGATPPRPAEGPS